MGKAAAQAAFEGGFCTGNAGAGTGATVGKLGGAEFMMKSLTLLFKDALIIALPVMASLFLINVTVGILSKAAPQMNLLSEGFPVLMLTAYFLIFVLVPQFIEFFEGCFKGGLFEIEKLLIGLKGGGQ